MFERLDRLGSAPAKRSLVSFQSFAFVLICFLCSPVLGASSIALAANPDGVAVIIGNRDYSGIPNVDFAHRDADAFRDYVINVLGYDEDNIIDLRNATQAQMLAVLGNRESYEGRLWSYLIPGGVSDVVVYYSGHGVPSLRTERGYLLPSDADADVPEINGYPIDLLYENLSKLEARSVTVYLDACFSGGSHAGMLIRSASPVFVSPDLPDAGVGGLTVLTAANGDQLASWDEEAEHGLFTRHLLDGLYGAADDDGIGDGDGLVTASEVKRYLDRRMTRAARRTYIRNQVADLLGDPDRILSSVPDFGWRGTQVAEAEVAETRTEETQVAALTPEPTPEPSYEILEADEVLYVQSRSNVRSGPGTEYDPPVGQLQAGEQVTVTGRVEGMDWARIALAAGEEAFIYAPLLGDEDPIEVAARQAEAARLAEEQRATEEAARLAEELRQAEEAARVQIATAWDTARSVDTIEAYQGFLSQHPDAEQSEEAQYLLEELIRSATVLHVGDIFRDCEGAIVARSGSEVPEGVFCGPEMVVVPSGSFMMGSPPEEEGRYKDEGPVHEVQINEPFAVGVYEVTFAVWEACVEAFVCNGNFAYVWGSRRHNHPVGDVTWREATEYVRWLSDTLGENYQLLSEAKWEYVARAGSQSRYWWGDEFDESLVALGNGIEAVGSYAPNSFGLHDVIGNVSEWTQDCWNESYDGAPIDGRPRNSGDCSRRVTRGGSHQWGASAAYRLGISADVREDTIGFRVARAIR